MPLEELLLTRGSLSQPRCTSQSLALGTYDYVDVNVAVVTHLSLRLGVPASEQPADRADEVRAASELAMATLERKLSDPETQVLVVNADDPATAELLRRLNNAVPVVTFGMSNSRADVFVESYKNNIWETEVSC
jgi:UDP-N-acetylmuramoyl-L-alanyl-D-glutamate--2,6-diaminopimelate ligase